MIIHFAHGGRLGNQLFAIAEIEAIRRAGEWVLCSKLDDALGCVHGLRRYLPLRGRLANAAIDRLLNPIAYSVLGRLRIISTCVEKGEDRTLVQSRGIFPVTYLRGYYQRDDSHHPEPGWSLKLGANYRASARRRLDEAGGRTPLFIHVRRGDYLTFTIDGKVDPSLPLNFYADAIARLKEAVADPFFFLLGDEPQWLEAAFPGLPHASVSRHPAIEDFALMTLCSGGVISNSSFAWWGAALCQGSAPVIGPLYWLGWRSEAWHPKGIQSARFQYIPVRGPQMSRSPSQSS